MTAFQEGYRAFRETNPNVDDSDRSMGQHEEGSATAGLIGIQQALLAIAWEVRILSGEVVALREVQAVSG